jgi:hypothetical protein
VRRQGSKAARGPAAAPANPFLPATANDAAVQVAEPDDDLADEFFGPAISTQGPAVPVGLAGPMRAFMPIDDVGEEAPAHLIWVVGLHGGSGASTITRLLDQSAQTNPDRGAGQFSRDVTEWSPRGWPSGPGPQVAARVLLVARTHLAGLDNAAAAAEQWASGRLDGVQLLGLVLVDDAPRPTSVQRAAVQRVSALVPECWHVPWIPAWRDLAAPQLADAPRRVRGTALHIVDRARDLRAAPTER